MEEEIKQSPTKKEPEPPPAEEEKPAPAAGGGGGGWGGWGISPFSVLSDLQKAATVAAEEISRNAVAAAKSIGELQIADPESESPKEGEDLKESASVENHDDEDADDDNKLRKSALDKLEKASEDSILGQGLKVLDSSVENFASGAWQAFGSAWKGGSELVHKLESSAANIAESIQHTGLPVTPRSVAPSSLLETGKAFTAKGMQVLERVGKETMDLLISETGIELEKNPEAEQQAEEEQLFEEVTFDRCFYIYGGPEQLEELEALSSHYALLFNRRKTKLSSEQRSIYDGKLKEVQQIFNLRTVLDSDKGKKIDAADEGSGDDMKILRDASVSKAADMAAGFSTSLAGLAANEIIQRTAGRLETIHSEGVHRLSELCCFAVLHLMMLGKSVISAANKAQNEEQKDDVKIDWPEDSVARAKIIRTKAQLMTGDVATVHSSFITGISDVVEAYQAAIKGATSSPRDGLPQTSIQEKANAITTHLRADQATAVEKIQDGLQCLAFVVLSTSMPTA